MVENKLVLELANRLNGIAILSSDITDKDLSGVDFESLIAMARARFSGIAAPSLLTKDLLVQIVKDKDAGDVLRERSSTQNKSFEPMAKGISNNFAVANQAFERTGGKVSDFADFFNDRLEKLKAIIYDSQSSSMSGMIHNIESVKQYTRGREVVLVGMVYDKIITKNGHVLITLEDETGTAKILFIKPEQGRGGQQAAELFMNSKKIVNDEVIAVRGKVSDPFIIASALVHPDVPVRQKKKIEEDIAIAFMSDIHIGSRLFQQKQFDRFIDWMNGRIDHKKELAGKIKYIVVSGDLVDGIGVYPGQERELSIDDIYRQYYELFSSFAKLPEYVQIFFITGNHDAVQRAEPQPTLPEEFYRDFKLSNIHLAPNPSYIMLNGIRVLGYHGTSLDSIIQGIPGCSYSKPEDAMLEILKRRHLSPIYGDNPIVPSKNDSMVIDKVPDILHMGHLHKNGYSEYHGTLIVNSGTWQGRTDFQVRMGHIPTPAQMPVYEAKSGTMNVIDFNSSGL